VKGLQEFADRVMRQLDCLVLMDPDEAYATATKDVYVKKTLFVAISQAFTRLSASIGTVFS